MQIDGYTPADPHIATEVGVELEYSTKFGKIHIRARSTGKDNTEFRKAAEKLNRRREISEKLALAARVPVDNQLQETLGLWFDTVVMSWSTTIKSDGKEVKPSRETFIALLSSDVLMPIFGMLIDDCADAANFTKQADEDAAKN